MGYDGNMRSVDGRTATNTSALSVWMRLFQFAELVRAVGDRTRTALPCKVEYLLEVVQLLVQMRIKAKVKGEIEVEPSVKGKRVVLRIPAFA